MLDSWNRGGSDELGSSAGSITLVRNENYWKTDPETGDLLPYLDGVVFQFIPETESLLRLFAARELDVINPPPSIEGIDGLTALTADGVVVRAGPGPVWEHFGLWFGELNRNDDSLNRYVAFRRAVAHAIDRNAIANDLLSGHGEALSSYVDVFTPALSGRSLGSLRVRPERGAPTADRAVCRAGERLRGGVVPNRGSLPRTGMVDGLKNKTDIDYGGYGVMEQIHIPGAGAPFWTGLRNRMDAPGELVSGNFKHSDEFMKLSFNPGGGTGGICFGDSGGPDLLAGTDTVLAVNSYVTNGNCAGVGYSSRVDIPEVLDWIESFL